MNVTKDFLLDVGAGDAGALYIGAGKTGLPKSEGALVLSRGKWMLIYQLWGESMNTYLIAVR